MTTPDPLKLARDALQKLACLGNGDKPGNSTGNVIALTALAAIDAMPASVQAVAWHMRVIGCDGSADWLEMGAAHPETPQGVEALPLVYAPASVPSGELAATIYVEVLKCPECQHVDINADDGAAACTSCDWHGPSQKNDHCPGCGSDGTMTMACTECGHRTVLLASATLPVSSSAITAQAAPAPAAVPAGMVLVPLRMTQAMRDITDAGEWEWADLLAAANAVTPEEYEAAQAAPAHAEPEFTDNARAALLWVLWHHQGGSSPIGQPLRYALGMGAHEELTADQIAAAKAWATLTRSTTADFHSARIQAPAAQALTDARDAALYCALRDLEDACQERAGLLSREAYLLAEQAPGMLECLGRLDRTRQAAREVLKATQAPAAPAVAAPEAPKPERTPFTQAQLRRLYDNSPEIGNDVRSRYAFYRVAMLVEAAHGITAPTTQEPQQ